MSLPIIIGIACILAFLALVLASLFKDQKIIGSDVDKSTMNRLDYQQSLKDRSQDYHFGTDWPWKEWKKSKELRYIVSSMRNTNCNDKM